MVGLGLFVGSVVDLPDLENFRSFLSSFGLATILMFNILYSLFREYNVLFFGGILCWFCF